MLVRSPDAMQGMGFIIILPLTFLAGVFVPISGMDAVPRAIGEWDPLSALVAAIRMLQAIAPGEVQRALNIEADGSFSPNLQIPLTMTDPAKCTAMSNGLPSAIRRLTRR